MLCKTCRRAVIRTFQGEERSAHVEDGEFTEDITCPMDISCMNGTEKIYGKLTACSKYLPTEATIAKENSS